MGNEDFFFFEKRKSGWFDGVMEKESWREGKGWLSLLCKKVYSFERASRKVM